MKPLTKTEKYWGEWISQWFKKNHNTKPKFGRWCKRHINKARRRQPILAD